MHRRIEYSVFFLFLTLSAVGREAWADVGPPAEVRLVRELTGPAIPEELYEGTFEIRVGDDGLIESISIDGAGWRGLEVDAADSIRVSAGDVLRFQFSGTPGEDSQDVRISFTFDDRPVVKRFDLSQERFARSGKPGRAASLNEAGRVVPFRPKVSGARNTAGGQQIRFHGRLAYQRPLAPDSSPITLGGDNVYFEIKDDDPPPSDDTIYAGFTDPFGYFDVTVNWDDCDITGCDVPDIYIRWELDDPIVNVQHADLFEEDYSWSTEDDTIDDFNGSEVDFGTLMPADSNEFQAIHIHNSIIRAHRYILALDGSDVPHVDVLWPDGGTGAKYKSFPEEEIHISTGEQWVEGTQTHEYGHHYMNNFATLLSSDYCNGYCDTCTWPSLFDCVYESNCGHCVWCKETNHDAWSEGFADWLGYVVNQTYILDYGITPYSINDGRYTLEIPQDCKPDRTQCTTDADCNGGTCGTTTPGECFVMHDPYITEGFIAALLRDMVDNNPAPPALLEGQISASDCQCDAMSIGVEAIFTVVRLDQPTNPADFIRMFWNRYPEYRQDFWSTVTNIFPLPVPGMDFSLPEPIVVSQTAGCQAIEAPAPIELNVQGNGSLLHYQWRKDSTALADGFRVTGTQTPTLTINPSSESDQGVYDCVVSTCDGTLSTNSAPVRVSIHEPLGSGTKGGSWGGDESGALGRGFYTSIDGTPAPMAALADVVKMAHGPTTTFFQFALLANGDVWSWGGNNSQQLARPEVFNPASTATPGPIVDPRVHDVIDIASGVDFGMALTSDGDVLVWGGNGNAEHGNGDDHGSWPSNIRVPTVVPGLDCVVSIAAGSQHCAAVRSDGSVWTWGYDDLGQTGFDEPSRVTIRPRHLPGITDAVAVAAGDKHTLVLRNNGIVIAFGQNGSGQLGDGTVSDHRSAPMPVINLSNAQAVRAGQYHSLAILQDGTVRAWGAGYALGINANVAAVSTPVQPLNLGQVVDVEAGSEHTIFLKADGTVWTTGGNVHGELGPRVDVGPGDPRFHPERVVDIQNAKGIAAGAYASYVLADGMGPQFTRPIQNSGQAFAGQSHSFSVVGMYGSPTLEFQWLLNDEPLHDGSGITGSSTPLLTINPVQLSHEGQYYVTVRNAFGELTSRSTDLAVYCPRGDTDCNGKMDVNDADDLAVCFSGPGNQNLPQNCAAADFHAIDIDNDGDVDLGDVALFLVCFSGLNQQMPPECAHF